MRRRVFLAFAVAPVAAVALLWSLMLASREPLTLAFLFIALVYAYIVTGLLGVPVYTLISPRDLHAPYGNALIGALVGLVPAAVLYLVTTRLYFIIEIVMASAFGGLVFGLIAGRDLTIVGRKRER